MTTIYNVYDQLSQILARLDSKSIQVLKADDALQSRFDGLSEKLKNQQLTASEKDELDHYVVLERLMRLSKIRASQAIH
jgi:hypothetical protein